MAGRFFATGDTDTESSTESSDEEIPKANLGAIRLGSSVNQTAVNLFHMCSDDNLSV